MKINLFLSMIYAAFFSVLVYVAVSAVPAPAAAPEPVPGKPAPAFEAADSNGKTVALSDYLGRTVVLEWTNHGCPFVQKHYDAGNMQALQKQVTADGVVWLSIISSAPGKQGHVSGEEANRLTADRGAAPTAVLLDADGTVGKLYGAKTTPHMFVIDDRGFLAYAGAIDANPSYKWTEEPVKNYVLAALEDLKAGTEVQVASTQPYGCSVKYAE